VQKQRHAANQVGLRWNDIIQRRFASAVCKALQDVGRNAGQTVVSTVKAEVV